MLKNQNLINEPSMKAIRARKIFLSQEAFNHHLVKMRNAAKWKWEIQGDIQQEISIIKAGIQMSKKSTSPKKLNLSCSYGISDRSLAGLCQSFKKFTALKNLHLSLRHCSKTTQTGIYNLSEGLKRLTSLEKLNLHFDNGFSYLTDKSLGTLSQGVRRQISLKKFRLTIWGRNPMTNLGIQNICKGLQNLVFLRRLELNLNECDMITDEGMGWIKKLLKKLKNLKQVKFHFTWCGGISLKGIEQITQGLEPLHLSKNMNIAFLKDLCSIILTDMEQDFQSRIFFQMKFGGQNMKDDFGALENFLNKFPALENLDFVLQNVSKIDKSGLKHLSRLWNNSASLQSKSLKIRINDRMNNKEIECLASFLKSLVALNFVVLLFLLCSKIPEKALQSLSKGLSKHSLEKMRIHFVDCEDLFENKLEKISRILKKMTSLKIIEFDFDYKVSDSGIQKIVESLNYLVALDTVTLRFSWEHQITKDGREKMIETLKSHKSLLVIKIYFGLDLEVIEGWRSDQGKDKGGLLGRIMNFMKKAKKG